VNVRGKTILVTGASISMMLMSLPRLFPTYSLKSALPEWSTLQAKAEINSTPNRLHH
jgi:hypothetical protein